MSEKLQHTTESIRETMMNHYGDEIHHKHDKRHSPFRRHCRSHQRQTALDENSHVTENHRTGLVGLIKLKKFRKRLSRREIH